MIEINGSIYLEVNGRRVLIPRSTLTKFFEDREALRKLITIELVQVKSKLAELERYIKAVVEEEKRYGFDFEKYPPELRKKVIEVENLDDLVGYLKDEIKTLEIALGEIEGNLNSGGI